MRKHIILEFANSVILSAASIDKGNHCIGLRIFVPSFEKTGNKFKFPS